MMTMPDLADDELRGFVASPYPIADDMIRDLAQAALDARAQRDACISEMDIMATEALVYARERDAQAVLLRQERDAALARAKAAEWDLEQARACGTACVEVVVDLRRLLGLPFGASLTDAVKRLVSDRRGDGQG